MQRYGDPSNLPSPDGTVTHNGVIWNQYGRTEVPENFSQEHQQVRQHMAATPSGQKYLAHLEQGPGNPVSIVPYEASGGRSQGLSQEPGTRPIPHRAGQVPTNIRNSIGPQTEFSRFGNDSRTLVTYPVNQGLVTGRGESISGATIAAHELRHASQGRGRDDESPLGNWTNKNEKATITKGDNPTALAHGEGLRDDHKSGGLFETGNITSTTPLSPRANAAITSYQPELRTLTNELDATGADAARPGATAGGSEAFNLRNTSMSQLKQELGGLGPTGGTAS